MDRSEDEKGSWGVLRRNDAWNWEKRERIVKLRLLRKNGVVTLKWLKMTLLDEMTVKRGKSFVNLLSYHVLNFFLCYPPYDCRGICAQNRRGVLEVNHLWASTEIWNKRNNFDFFLAKTFYLVKELFRLRGWRQIEVITYPYDGGEARLSTKSSDSFLTKLMKTSLGKEFPQIFFLLSKLRFELELSYKSGVCWDREAGTQTDRRRIGSLGAKSYSLGVRRFQPGENSLIFWYD